MSYSRAHLHMLAGPRVPYKLSGFPQISPSFSGGLTEPVNGIACWRNASWCGARQAARCRSARRTERDPTTQSMDELRAELERSPSPGFITGFINWLSKAATSTASGFDLKAVYRWLLARARPRATSSWDEELAALDQVEVGAEGFCSLWVQRAAVACEALKAAAWSFGSL
jgi:hypothetical protein